MTAFEDWYTSYQVDSRDGAWMCVGSPQHAQTLYSMYQRYKSEIDQRLAGYDKLESWPMVRVISPKPTSQRLVGRDRRPGSDASRATSSELPERRSHLEVR